MSYVILFADRVKFLAESKLRQIESRRQEAWRIEIHKILKNREFWRKIFRWLKPMTEAQAREFIFIDSYGFKHPDWIGWREEQVCKDLLKLAEADVEDKGVWVSSEDHSYLYA